MGEGPHQPTGRAEEEVRIHLQEEEELQEVAWALVALAEGHLLQHHHHPLQEEEVVEEEDLLAVALILYLRQHRLRNQGDQCPMPVW